MTQYIQRQLGYVALFGCLAAVGAIALQASAETADTSATPMEVRQENRAERMDLVEAQRTERMEVRAELREDADMMRDEGALPEDRPTRAQVREMLLEQREERVAQRLEQREEFHGALTERRDQLRTRVEERRAEMAANQEERKARLEEAAQARLGGFASRTTNGMEHALANLTSVADRVYERIAYLRDAGADVTAASDVFEGTGEGDGVYALLATAQSDIAALATILNEAIASDDPKADMTLAREAATVAKESIQLVHQALRDTVVELKAQLALVETEQDDEYVAKEEELDAEEDATDTEDTTPVE